MNRSNLSPRRILIVLSALLLGTIGGAIVYFTSTQQSANVPALADVKDPDWSIFQSPPHSENAKDSPIIDDPDSMPLEVVDDTGTLISSFMCAFSANATEWQRVPVAQSTQARVQREVGFLFVAAENHLSRMVEITPALKIVRVELLRLPQVQVQVDNGLGLGFKGIKVEIRLEAADFPDAGLRLPLKSQDPAHPLRPLVRDDRIVLDIDESSPVDFIAAMPFYRYTARIADSPFDAAQIEFTPQPGGKLVVRVPFGEGPFIVGRVVDEGGRLLSGVEVKFSKYRVRNDGLREFHQMAATMSGEDGRFMLAPEFPETQLPNELRFQGDGWLKLQCESGGELRTAQVPVTVASQLTNVGDVPVGAGLSISGRVYLGDTAASNLRYDVWTEAGVLPGYTDESGNFRISGIAASEDLAITVSAPGHKGVKTMILDAALAGELVEIRLQPLQVSGIRLLASKETLASAILRYRSEYDEYWSVIELRATDFRQMPPGTYQVFVATDTAASAIEELIVTDGVETSYKPVMKPAVRLRISGAAGSLYTYKFSIHDADGFALTGVVQLSAGGVPYEVTVLPDVQYELRLTHPVQRTIEILRGRAGETTDITLDESTD